MYIFIQQLFPFSHKEFETLLRYNLYTDLKCSFHSDLVYTRVIHIPSKIGNSSVSTVSSCPFPANHWSAFCHWRLALPVPELPVNGILQSALLCLASCPQLDISEIHPCCCLSGELITFIVAQYSIFCIHNLYFSIHPLMDIWMFPIWGYYVIKLLWTFECKSFCGHVLSFLSRNCLGVERLHYRAGVCLAHRKLPSWFLMWLCPFTPPPAVSEHSSSSTASSTFGMVNTAFWF